MAELVEQWRPIEGYEGQYEVSNLGRVKSLKWGKEKILRPLPDKYGYLRVHLYKEGRKTFSVHRLVAQAFIPNPEGLPEINHKDENPSNDQADNLEWCDRKYNCTYGTRIEREMQTKIRNGRYDPDRCGLDEKKRKRLYYQKNRDWFLEYGREQYQKNRDQILEQKREQYQKNLEEMRKYGRERKREYRQKNREKILEYQRGYYREYRQKNREKILEYQRGYRRRKKQRQTT